MSLDLMGQRLTSCSLTSSFALLESSESRFAAMMVEKRGMEIQETDERGSKSEDLFWPPPGSRRFPMWHTPNAYGILLLYHHNARLIFDRHPAYGMSAFIVKKKPRLRPKAEANQNGSGPAIASSSGRAQPSSGSNTATPLANDPAAPSDPSKMVEFKLLSGSSEDGLRYNMMRLAEARDIDPREIARPIFMNRKHPGAKAPPIFATDEQGQVTGRYVYDNEGKPVVDAKGERVVEKRSEKDMSLIGAAPDQSGRRKVKKGVKEVFHQDVNVIRLRREENTPWILESGNAAEEREQGAVPAHWVGRMTEAAAMPSVLLVNDGTMGMGFKVVPMGRTYRFVPERPFKALDAEAAHKLVSRADEIGPKLDGRSLSTQYEHQAKHRLHDRWAQRQGGPLAGGSNQAGMARNRGAELAQERRAMDLEMRMTSARGENLSLPTVKQQRFNDDYAREGRMMERVSCNVVA